MPEFCFICAILIFLGAFYTFAGIAATRAALTSYFFDWAIARISLKRPSRAETLRTVWLLGAAFVVLAGGLSLILQLEIAAWIFVASALGQAFYIAVFAPKFLDPEDPPDASGRRQTINAFMLYSIVTVGIAWAANSGKLRSAHETNWVLYAILLGLLAAHILYVITRLMKLKATPSEDGSNDDPDTTSIN